MQNGERVYRGHLFEKLRSKVRFATYFGEIVQVTLLKDFSEKDLPALRDFLEMWLRNDYRQVNVQIEGSALSITNLKGYLAQHDITSIAA